MPTMNVSVTSELAEMVSRKVDSGLYGNASEVVRDALRLMYERDRLQDVTLIREKLARGLQQAENGEFTEQSVGEIIAEAKARKNAKKPSTS
jgi:antitoxin ParD1/3/4